MNALTDKTPPDALPRKAVAALGLLLLVTLLSVAAVRLSGTEIRTPDAPAAAQRSLRFEDGPNGTVTVIDARTGAAIDSVAGEAGFLRGSLRALVRERKMRGIGSGPAFELIARTDGRLTLMDPATGERLDLESFGPTNSAIYRRWLQAGATPSTVSQ
jgi:putative photosynthetic complex assembly protein